MAKEMALTLLCLKPGRNALRVVDAKRGVQRERT
jgi:hypothetical protein